MKNIWIKIKKWALTRAVPWLKKSWMQIVNVIVLFTSYGCLNEETLCGTLVGLWIFVLLGYYIFWKLFGMESVVKDFIKRKEK